MAVFGSLNTVRAQTAGWPGFSAAFGYLDSLFREGSGPRTALLGLADGESQRVDLEDGAFAIAQVYAPRPRYGVFESHRRYYDIQVIVVGEEQIEVSETALLTLSQAYDAEKDFALYADCGKGAANVLRLRAGDAAVFAPRDGHMPSVRVAGREGGVGGADEASAPALVYKVVVKVPVD